MAHFPYVSDNPYRLLGVGSALGRDELSRRAQAGSPARTGLRSIFGDEDLPRCAEIAATLAGDPEQRTITRCFWPLHGEIPPDANDGLEDFERLSPAEPALAGQLAFLANWFAYLVTSDAERLERALAGFSDLCGDEAFTARLAGLLQNEGESAARARSLVDAAQRAIAAHLLTDACRRAVERWVSGSSEPALALIHVVCGCRLGEAADRALRRELVPAGDGEMNRLRRAIDTFDGRATEVPDRREFGLRELAGAVGDRVPEAARWLETAEERMGQVVSALREHAIVLANDRDDYEGARRILERILDLPLPPMLRRRGENDLSKLEKVETVEKEHRIWRDVQPLRAAPLVFSLGGIGTRMCGRNPFAGREGWYFSTLYFCILYVPLFPLGHYLVSDARPGRHYFHGRAPLTRGNRYHAFAAFAAALLLFIRSNVEPSRVRPPAQRRETSAASQPIVSITPSGDGKTKLTSRRDEPVFTLPETSPRSASAASSSAEPDAKTTKPVFTLDAPVSRPAKPVAPPTKPVVRPVNPTPRPAEPVSRTAQPNPKPPVRETPPPPIYVPTPIPETAAERRERLVDEWKTLERQNELVLPTLRKRTAELEAGDRELKARLSWLKKEAATLDRSQEGAVNDFNARANLLQADGRDADRRWKDHDREVDAYNRRVDRLSEIARVLGKMGD